MGVQIGPLADLPALARTVLMLLEEMEIGCIVIFSPIPTDPLSLDLQDLVIVFKPKEKIENMISVEDIFGFLAVHQGSLPQLLKGDR